MVDVSDIPGLGAFAGLGTLLVDLVFSGGDLIMWLGVGLLSSVDLWIPMLSTLDRLADQVGWIPDELISTLMTVVLVIVLVVYIGRIGSRITDTDTNDN